MNRQDAKDAKKTRRRKPPFRFISLGVLGVLAVVKPALKWRGWYWDLESDHECASI
jgi:hypothetical protein